MLFLKLTDPMYLKPFVLRKGRLEFKLQLV
jgi:hypothetical protein